MDARFEDHCWREIVPRETLDLYAHYARETCVGPAPALLAIDLYELAYQGGPQPIAELADAYPSSCGAAAWAAIPQTQALFAAARGAGIPVFYSTQETRPDARPRAIHATQRKRTTNGPELYEIKSEFAPQPGDTVIRKMRASAFFGTPLAAQLTALGIRSLIICGESTSGCVRASAVDAYSHGFHVTIAEECCFDRSPLSHAINLFDLHHKYADVMRTNEIVAALRTTQA